MIKDIVRKNILEVKPYIPGRPIEEVKRELKLKDVIKLASNENPFGPSPKVLQAMVAALRSVNRYPDGNCFYLRRELARQLRVAENQLIFGNGSDEVIAMVARAFVGGGDEVVMARHSFLMYEISAQVSGATIKWVPLKNFRYDLEGILAAVNERTKAIFIGNPDNPAGTYIPQNELEDFLNKLNPDIIVFIDEAYFEFVGKSDYPDAVELQKIFKNVISSRTFSKLYGLAGLRIGFGVADAEIVGLLDRVRGPFNVNSLAQAAALACLKDKAYYKRLLKVVYSQRKYLCQNFKRLNLPFVESVTNFILVDVKKDSTEVFKALLKKGVIVRDMSFLGLGTYIRVTIGTEKENRKFMSALEEIL